MNIIKINASRSYEVHVGKGLLCELGQQVRLVTKAASIAIISDSNVWPLYGETVVNSLREAGYIQIIPFVFEAGEQSKNGDTFLRALAFLAENHITRSDCIIALGGGVVGDLAGFTAACYLRGIDYIQVPTSLLACVDSSVGGKTAIDLQAGKNLAGAFYQPRLVLCDVNTLDSLPLEVFRDGCAEVIKYGVLYDPELFEHLEKHGMEFDREWVISRCVTLKRDVVAADEFDKGQRQKLNLGHTIGHGIEANSDFKVTHGQAVAIGMAIIARASVRKNICNEQTEKAITNILQHFGLPADTNDSAHSIYLSALSDKKRSGGTVNLIVPERIGCCSILPVAVTELESLIELGLTYGDNH